MARRGIAHVVILRVDIQREECTQGTMDWHSRLHHRGDKRGGDTVPGNVGYQDTDAVLIDRNEIVKIACHGGHGLVSGGVYGGFLFQDCRRGESKPESHGRSPVRFSIDSKRRSLSKTISRVTYPNENKLERQIPASPRLSKTGSQEARNVRLQGFHGEKQSSYKQNLAVWRNEKPVRQFWHHGDRQQNSEGARLFKKGINVPAEPVKTKRPIPDKPTTSPA